MSSILIPNLVVSYIYGWMDGGFRSGFKIGRLNRHQWHNNFALRSNMPSKSSSRAASLKKSQILGGSKKDIPNMFKFTGNMFFSPFGDDFLLKSLEFWFGYGGTLRSKASLDGASGVQRSCHADSWHIQVALIKSATVFSCHSLVDFMSETDPCGRGLHQLIHCLGRNKTLQGAVKQQQLKAFYDILWIIVCVLWSLSSRYLYITYAYYIILCIHVQHMVSDQKVHVILCMNTLNIFTHI